MGITCGLQESIDNTRNTECGFLLTITVTCVLIVWSRAGGNAGVQVSEPVWGQTVARECVRQVWQDLTAHAVRSRCGVTKRQYAWPGLNAHPRCSRRVEVFVHDTNVTISAIANFVCRRRWDYTSVAWERIISRMPGCHVNHSRWIEKKMNVCGDGE